ncbi:MAG: YczE/YyaS/YitT family protein [Rectinemataceae bacterium]
MTHFPARLARLFLGLFLYALGIVLTMKANIGYAPWEVFHAGIGRTIGMSIGNVSIVAGLLIVLVTFLLGEKSGFGTVLNMVFIGVFMDLLLGPGFIPTMTGWLPGIALLLAGLFTISLASFFYIGSGFGAGPRDGLMVALRRKTGLSIGLCRGGIEVAAVLIGWLLGGMVGAGTVISALAIGLCVQLTFRLLGFDPTQVRHETMQQTWRGCSRRS